VFVPLLCSRTSILFVRDLCLQVNAFNIPGCGCVGFDRMSDISSLSDHLVSPLTYTLTADQASEQAASSPRFTNPFHSELTGFDQHYRLNCKAF